ncbi:MAG: bifunctional metallophosphatase/5'-nucleotidase [Flavobacteriaceae bacterium]
MLSIKKKWFVWLLIFWVSNCTSPNKEELQTTTQQIAIFSINDPHGRLNNFSKIKPILDAAKENYEAVFFVSAGDLFSGNPIVDFYTEKGYPIIDLLNDLEMDVSVLGNHEFDYGQEALSNRITQAKFPFLCANMRGGTGALATVPGAVTLEKNGFRVAFVGIVETSSPQKKPLTHPKKISGLDFQDGIEVFASYTDYKAAQNAAVLIALTHQGEDQDAALLNSYPAIDVVIGGHTNQIYGKQQPNGLMVMSGKYLETLGKTVLTLKNGVLQSSSFSSIDLDTSLTENTAINNKISSYNQAPEFFEVLGQSAHEHNRTETACFYVNAIRNQTQADLVIQNSGGVRNDLHQGDITPFSIYSIDPFGNGIDTYEMTVAEIEVFFSNYRASFSYDSAYVLEKQQDGYRLVDAEGQPLSASMPLSFALNDYITNTNSASFTSPPTYSFPLTTAEYLMEYVRSQTVPIDFSGCDQKE